MSLHLQRACKSPWFRTVFSQADTLRRTPLPSMSFPHKKRKFADVAAPTKYYAVRAGHKPGVYENWSDCQANITGFKGASFKSFLSLQEARDFAAGIVSATSSTPQGDKFYGVAVGHVPGVYQDWNLAAEQIKDFKGPKYRKFNTKAEAEEFVRTGGQIPANAEPSAKKPKKAQDNAVHVYTDGSSRGNGKKGALAGVGVFFSDGDSRNVSEPLAGMPQTNQRAELTAIQRALEIVPRDRDVRILTDSNYAINCATVWYASWKRNAWMTAQREPVMNKDIVVAIRELIDERDAKGAKTDMEWIKGHSNDPGNEAADKLAVAGAFAERP